jgi:multidrug resistance efflux pump
MVSPTVPVISIVNLDTVVVQAGVDEEQVNSIRVGQELMVKVGSVRESLLPALSPMLPRRPVKPPGLTR